ncbi:MAG: prolyl oligopeptidase family serine peptidase [Saonia sp.]
MKKTILITSLIFCILSTLSHAQSSTENKNSDSLTQQKRPLTPEDYRLWSKMYGENISNNGDWYSYKLWHGNRIDRTDSLFIGATQKDINYSFPPGAYGQFSPSSGWFGCLVPEKGMALVNLEKDGIQWIPYTTKFEFSADGRYLVGLGKATDSLCASQLWIMDLERGKQESITGATEFLLNPTSNGLAYIMDTKGKKAVKLLRFKQYPTKTITITENALNPYKKMVWNDQGNALAFLQELPEGPQKQKRHKIYHYTNTRGRAKLQTLDPTTDTSQFPYSNIMDTYLKVSEDGATVFFKVQKLEEMKKTKHNFLGSEVQVWGTRDKQLYPEKKRLRNRKYSPKLATWWPKKEKVMFLETDSLPVAVLTGDRKQLLSYNPEESGLHFKEYGDIDFYLTDLETDRYKLFLKQQNGAPGLTLVSPGGRYIAYFRDQHWWAYDLEKKTHANMTQAVEVPVYDVEHDRSSVPPPYGIAGWTQGDRELLVYDQYDVWLLSPKGKVPRRLTQGRESQIRYRIDENVRRSNFRRRWFTGFERETFDLSEGLMLETLGKDMASGYSLWKPGKEVKPLVYTDMHVNGLKKAGKKEAYIYKEQSFDTSPRLLYWEPGMPEPKILVKSNPQQENFQWGRAELLRYPGPDGKPLQGALFYPANYTLREKYPMIVNIYELKSKELHRYVNPTEYLQDGWNLANYTTEGYLVFYPDIRYTPNDPGISAVNCIEAGVKAVLAKGIVDKDRVGLIGHSFGGYETAFAVTQTDLFATAVAGAAVTDLVSWYHTLEGDYGKDVMSFFEDGQFRFTNSFYQNPAAYFRNSPLHHAGNINTPLLLWTGEEDYHVDWHQSVELYLGLRRLNKACKLLIYPEENHSFLKPKNQMDLTQRIKRWFDAYLKPEEKGKGTE